MNTEIKICHVTTVHSSDDARIFHKECTSLAETGYKTFLVAPGISREQNKVTVIGMGNKPEGIKKRATEFAQKTINKALELNCNIYHLHDPELLLYAKKLKKSGAKVIFDSHEDYYFGTEYFPKGFVTIANIFYRWYESHVISNIDAVVCCYRKTKERFEKKCEISEMIYNFPIESANQVRNYQDKKEIVLGYAGGISKIWNHKSIIEAMENVENSAYILAGSIYDNSLEELKGTEGWEKVDLIGKVPFNQVNEKVYNQANVGIALLTYIRECNGTEGNLSNTKLFEMMDAGLPVIATDFDLWKTVVEENHCGICVNPYDIQEVKKAIIFLRDNPEERKKMGENAKKAIQTKYNWHMESEKLLHLYTRTIER